MLKPFYTILASVIIATFMLGGCSALKGADVKNDYPLDTDDTRRLKRGKLSGEGGIKLWGGNSGEKAASGSGIGVNSFLWRAVLDTISFIPLSSVDPHGGVIITDWYEDPDARGEKFKLNILIMGTELKANALRVSVFKKIKNNGTWEDGKVSGDLASKLEDKILTRAREMRIDASRQ